MEKLLEDTGFSVKFANVDGKPSVYSMLEGAWSFAAIVKGIRDEIWKTTYDLEDITPIVRLWYAFDLIDLKLNTHSDEWLPLLTSKGRLVVDTQDLLEYEFSMINQQLDSNHVTDPEKYKKLRKALGDYSVKYLPQMHEWLADNIRPQSHILDFGGGEGKYLQSVLEAHYGRGTTGVLADKSPSRAIMKSKIAPFVQVLEHNFTDNSFTDIYRGRFSAIIVSEVLHVMSKERREETYKQLWDLLSDNGVLFILEQHVNLRLDWRLHDMTDGGKCISKDNMIEEVHSVIYDYRLPVCSEIDLDTHYGVMFCKQAHT